MKRLIRFLAAVFFVMVFLFSTGGSVLAQGDQRLSVLSDEETTTYVSGITSGRAKSLVEVAVGLMSLIIGWRSKVRSKTNTSGNKTWPITALVLALVAMIFSISHLTNNVGGFGTGGGKAGERKGRRNRTIVRPRESPVGRTCGRVTSRTISVGSEAKGVVGIHR